MKYQIAFGFLNTQMVRLHKAILQEKLDDFGITYGQIGFIMRALRRPGRTQDDFSTVLSVDKGATARTIAKLEKRGFVYREENPENRRQKMVFPTEKSKQIRDELRHALIEANETMLSSLDVSDRELLVKLMTKVIDSCREKLGMPYIWDIL